MGNSHDGEIELWTNVQAVIFFFIIPGYQQKCIPSLFQVYSFFSQPNFEEPLYGDKICVIYCRCKFYVCIFISLNSFSKIYALLDSKIPSCQVNYHLRTSIHNTSSIRVDWIKNQWINTNKTQGVRFLSRVESWMLQKKVLNILQFSTRLGRDM